MTTYERVKQALRANDIIGKQTFVYDGDYDQWIAMFSHDKTEVD